MLVANFSLEVIFLNLFNLILSIFTAHKKGIQKIKRKKYITIKTK